MTKTSKVEKLYLAFSPSFGARFAFNATSDADAMTKVNGWNDYHSLRLTESKALMIEITPKDLPFYKVGIHNEYVSRY